MASQIDSRTVLDAPGAEDLIGRGDMLFQPSDEPKPIRMQGVFVSDQEINLVVDHWTSQRPKSYRDNWDLPAPKKTSGGSKGQVRDEEPADSLLDEAVQVILERDRASASLLQSRLRIGQPRAARIMVELEEKGYVGPADRSNARVVNRDKIAADATGANGGSTGGTSAAGETGEDA
jgi:S-DNA-T family DNA segregation ATPase FtsK/SpoIIIE